MQPAARRALAVDLARRHPHVLVAAGVFLYGIGPVVVAATDATGPVLSVWRLWFGVGVLGLGTVVAVHTGGAAWPSLLTPEGRRAWRYPAWAGVAFGLHQLSLFTALKLTSVTDTMLVSTLAPILVAVAAIRMFGERPGVRFRAWTLLAMAGAAIVALGASTGPEGNPFGVALALASVGFSVAFFLLSKQSRAAMSVLPFLLGAMFFAAITSTAYVLVAGDPLGEVTARDLWFAFILAAGPGGIGHFIMTWPLRWVAANTPPIMRLAQPVIAAVLAWLWLGQPILASHLVGGALTVAGVAGALLSPAGRALRSPGPPDPQPPA